MDRFKFRGKRVDNGEWVTGDLMRSTTGIRSSDSDEPFSDCWIIPRRDVDINFCFGGSEHSIHTKAFIVIAETVGQCTGLKDKNGTLIYEGDVVRSADPPYSFKKPIHWNGRWYQLGTSEIILCEMEVGCFGLEVIGNIHENPELLSD